MKLQCDVCAKSAASVFCSADEAALCDDCDKKVHCANKVASKHLRLSLSGQQKSNHPLCDICKESRGFVFCQEDRALLCLNCDDSIHSANELTMKHSRFLLTGTQISAICSSKIHSSSNKQIDSSEEKVGQISDGTSSISDYLIKTLPGYRVEDLLEFDISYKNDEMLPCSETEARFGYQCPVRVPQVQTSNYLRNDFNVLFDHNDNGLKYNQGRHELMNGGNLVQNRGDDSCMVPQINTCVSSNNKRFRPSSAWYS